MQQITRTDQIRSRIIRELFVYWQGKRIGQRLPRRADIDPLEIPRLMPNILIADIEYEPFRVRYRLVGTRVVQMTGFEFTGKYLDEIALPDDEGPFLECYRSACESEMPVLTRIKWHLAPDATREYDTCMLPLSEDGGGVDKVLAIECYENVERDYTLLLDRRYPRPFNGPRK